MSALQKFWMIFLRTLIGNYSISIGKQKCRKLMKLSFSELENATHHFTTRIGQGGSAIVYKVCPYAFLCLLSFRQCVPFEMVM